MGSSQTRAWTHVSCIGVRILYHWATKEALSPPDGSTSSWPSHSHTIQTGPTLYPPHPHCALCILTLVSNFQHSQPFILSGLPLPPLLALREPWLISLHLSWVETFSSYSSYAPYATSGWGWGEASSLFGIIFVLSFNSNSYSFLLQTISVFEVGPSCDIFHQPFEVHSSTHRLPWWLRR